MLRFYTFSKLKSLLTTSLIQSSMSTAEDDLAGAEFALSVGDAARHVCRVSLDFHGYPGHKFYRYGEVIDW